MTRVFIDGAAGTTGLEIEARLQDRVEYELIRLDARDRKSDEKRREALREADVAILCLPDAAAIEAVALASDRTRLIDASSAHRMAPGWTYGFPELGHDVANAQRVANPGCYPTGFLALIVPLVRAGLVPPDWPLTVNAVSGYSGGGKPLVARFVEEQTLAHRGYGFGLEHKHLPEMQQHGGLTEPPIFAPAVTRAFRGMVVEVPLHLSSLPARPTRTALLDTLLRFYETSAIIRVHHDRPDELLLREGDEPFDWVDLYVFADSDNRQARLVAVLDNLGKGASGAAVQNLNLMTGNPATAGLRL